MDGRSNHFPLWNGAVAAVVVYFTGRTAADSIFLPAHAQSALNNHADWALWTVWFYGVYAAVRFLITWKSRAEYCPKFHLGFFALSLIGLFLLFQTGYYGARMVFKYGIGVQNTEIEDPAQVTKKRDEIAGDDRQDQLAPTTFKLKENGDWVWEVEDGALQVLQEQFYFIDGSISQLNAEAVQTDDGSHALQFSGDSLDGFLVTHNTYQNVQLDYYLNMSSLDGTVMLVYHAQDSVNFDYVSITSDGSVEQGRVADGQHEVFEKGTTDTSRPLFVRTVANGTHFRGYIDKQLVLHGHGSASDPGSLGLKFEGSGSLLLEKMETVQL